MVWLGGSISSTNYRKDIFMEKLILTDNTELEIREGASLDCNTVIVPDFADLKTVAKALTKEGNLKRVQYKSGDQVTGNYENMKLEAPLFKSVDYTEDKKVIATFGIREKTEMELIIEELQRQQAETKAEQSVQDGAIMELAGMMGGEA